MKEEILEAYELIADLNVTLEEQGFPEWIFFELETNGYVVLITFGGIELYNSEISDRWFEDLDGKNCVYSLKEVVLKEFEKLKYNLNKLVL